MKKTIFATVLCAISLFAAVGSAQAGPLLRSLPTVWDSGNVANYLGGNQRINLRVYVEYVALLDGTYVWQVGYLTQSDDQGAFGSWKPVNKMYNLTFSFKTTVTDQYGHATTVTRANVFNLPNYTGSSGVLFDGTSYTHPTISNLTVTSQRSGGAHGFSVTVTH